MTLAGGRAVAVVSSDEKGRYCEELGAVGYVDRTRFMHWGVPPPWDSAAWADWLGGAKAFGKAIWDAVGERVTRGPSSSIPGRTRSPRRTSSATEAG